MMKLKENSLAYALFFLGIMSLSSVFLSLYNQFFSPNLVLFGFLVSLSYASLFLTGVFSLVAFYYHFKSKKK